MKNPLSEFSFGQIPTQWQQQKKSQCKVYKGFVGNKNLHKLPYFEEKNQGIARDLDNEFLEVTRTNLDPKNFSD
jgi:hypothetical protein